MKKNLVTTALESTWGSSNDYLCFLGDWCTIYSRRHVWGNRQHEVILYHWDDRNKLHEDFKYIQDLNKKITNNLVVILNDIHGTRYSSRVWNILIGNWLTQFTAVVFDRWSIIKKSEEQHRDNLETIILNMESKDFVPNHSTQASELFYDDNWNHFLCGKIIKNWTTIKVLEKDYMPDKENDETTMNGQKISYISRLKSLLRVFLNKVKQLFLVSKTYMFSVTYLGEMREFYLNLSLGLKATPMQTIEPILTEYDKNFRDWKINNNLSDDFESVLLSLIPYFMPKSYLEGFNKYIDKSKKLYRDSNTNVIFTSNSHFNDDLFKIFCLSKVDKGSKLIIGQHGGGPFHKFNGATSFELSIADKYLTTGTGNKGEKKEVVGQIFNRLKYNYYNKKGPALLITTAMPRYSCDMRSMVIAGQMNKYFDDQFEFYDNLPPNIQKQLTVRLHNVDYRWSQKQRWIDRFPNIKIDKDQKIKNSVGESRICVVTYAATSYNETLANNTPTIIYWNKDYWGLSKESEPYFQELKRVGIFHTSPKSAAKQLEKIWNDVDLWWNGDDLQEVRKSYCHAFAYRPKNLTKRIKKALIN